MKARLFFCMLFVVGISLTIFAINIPNDTISQTCSCQTDCCIQSLLGDSMIVAHNIHSETMSESLPYITTLINALNNAIDIQGNNIACITVIIAIIGLLIAFAGFYEFNKLTNNVREYKKRIDSDVKKNKNDIQEKINEFYELQIKLDQVQNIQNYQNQYLQKINQYLFSITNAIVDNNKDNPQEPSNIREILYHDYHIINLLLSPSDRAIGSFDYLKAKGTKEDFEDLIFISQNDPDDNKKRLATETIGFIKGRGV